MRFFRYVVNEMHHHMGPKSTYGVFAPQIGVKMWADRDGMHRFGVITLRRMYISCFLNMAFMCMHIIKNIYIV